MKSLDGMTPKKLLAVWTETARLYIVATSNAEQSPTKGPRALKRRAKRRRARELRRRLQRTTWKSVHEKAKKEAAS